MFKTGAESCPPWESRSMKLHNYGVLLSLALLLSVTGPAQTKNSNAVPTQFNDMSGMYSFEHEGEFVQITLEQRSAKADQAKPLAVTGFISRYGDSDSDRGAFLDHFITKGSLDGDRITFSTKPVHGVSYEFSGTVSRGAATRDKDGYYELRGTLTQNSVQEDKIVSARSREITMKLLPDLDSEPAKKK